MIQVKTIEFNENIPFSHFFKYHRVNVTFLAVYFTGVPMQVVGYFFPTEIVSNHLSRTLCRHVNKYDRETKEQNDLCSNVSTPKSSHVTAKEKLSNVKFIVIKLFVTQIT